MADDPIRHRQSRLVTDEDGTFDASEAREQSMPIESGEQIDTDELADHQRYIEGRGVYDERNAVNDLTGREWKFATKSVIDEPYPPDMQHDLRNEHGGQKPPRLCADLIERFSKAGAVVLDPFAGVGGTLLGASLCEYEGTGHRKAIGFERTARWIEIYEEVLERENAERRDRGIGPLAKQDIRHGDCADLITELDENSVDLLLTDVPYWHMDELEQTRNRAETRESKLGSFEDGEAATSIERTKSEWVADMGEKFKAFVSAVRPGGYVVVFIGDMYREQSYEMLSAELARSIETRTDLTLKANLIWYDPNKDLHVYGYPFSFIPSMVHQNVLVFRA